MEKLSPKEFALQAIAPYYKDPSICGYEDDRCVYLTNNGRKCVLGKYLKEPDKFRGRGSAISIFYAKTQEDILIPEAVGILSTDQWQSLQNIHDNVARNENLLNIRSRIDNLGLFTLEELEEYCSTH